MNRDFAVHWISSKCSNNLCIYFFSVLKNSIKPLLKLFVGKTSWFIENRKNREGFVPLRFVVYSIVANNVASHALPRGTLPCGCRSVLIAWELSQPETIGTPSPKRQRN